MRGGGYVNRVVLLSDGLANRGITEPASLVRYARDFRRRSISLTTMGVGLDYNENLMTSLASGGGGNYYFIESPRSLASILGKEFNMLGCVAAQNTVIELTLGRGVSVVDVVGAEFTSGDGHVRIPVGDVYAGERREFTVEVAIPPGRGTIVVAQGEVRYEPVRDRVSVSSLEGVRVRYSADAAEIERHRDLETQARADVALSTRGVERAMDALDKGKGEAALEEIAAARRILQASPALSGGATGAAIQGAGRQAERVRAETQGRSGLAPGRRRNPYSTTITGSRGERRNSEGYFAGELKRDREPRGDRSRCHFCGGELGRHDGVDDGLDEKVVRALKRDGLDGLPRGVDPDLDHDLSLHAGQIADRRELRLFKADDPRLFLDSDERDGGSCVFGFRLRCGGFCSGWACVAITGGEDAGFCYGVAGCRGHGQALVLSSVLRVPLRSSFASVAETSQRRVP